MLIIIRGKATLW